MSKVLKILPIILVVIAFGVRIYGAGNLFFWNIDEDRFGLTAKRILVDHRPVLIGYSLPGGEIYPGPIFPYILSLWYLIVRMNPFGLAILASIFGAFTTFLVYKIGSIIFESKRVGLFASLIYALSFLANVYSRVLTELTLVPILSLLVYLVLYQNIKYKKPKNLIWLGVVLLVASQNEGSSFSLLALVLASFLIFRFQVPIKKLINIAGLFILFNLPVFFFEIRHNFFITKSFVQFFVGKPAAGGITINFGSISNSLEIFPRTLSRLLFVSGPKNIADQILPCSDLINLRESSVPTFLFLTSVAIIAFFLFKTLRDKKAIGRKILAIHLTVMLLGILLYRLFFPGWLYEWMLVIYFPAFALILGYTFDKIYGWNKLGKIVVLILLGIFLIYNLRFLLKTRENFGLSAKASAVKYALSQIGNRPFYLDSIGSCYAQGYNYLFWYFGNFPKQSYSDDMFTPAYYTKSLDRPKVGVVMVNPSKIENEEFYQKYNSYKQKTIANQQIGNIEVLIVEDI
jgi:4-amino-4-deoxy-L-arabinose transferase-like glycosyltransferase